VFQNLVELFKTPAISALIGDTTAIFSVLLTQRLDRRAAELQWLRERRGQAFSELLTSLDSLGNVLMRVSANPTPENDQDFKTASERFLNARSMAELYAPKRLSILLGQADLVAILNAGTGNWLDTVKALGAIRKEIVQSARNQLGSER
jgi:hypothetical protein